MCEYCGCQSINAIRELTVEHDAVVDEIGEVTRALRDRRTTTAAAACRRISRILIPHTVVEEQGLFPAMAVEFPDQVEVLQGEHRAIEAVLAECAVGVPADPTWPARVIQALDLLRKHILKEQDGVFPATLSVLGNDDWTLIDDIRARVGSGLSSST
ncbi:hemerythrin domain-containing protein [Lapillicoccus sp.]|uniref:hemerythrin domain-containing protein n=1 Tax=Lapillicoccus sp. TaxID=1909287 RepID=UPI0025DE4482|nr:hemerythrin domain-containing protein [Lapillicoccus sp.]